MSKAIIGSDGSCGGQKGLLPRARSLLQSDRAAPTLVNAYPFTASHSVDHAQTPDSSPAPFAGHCARSRTRFPAVRRSLSRARRSRRWRRLASRPTRRSMPSRSQCLAHAAVACDRASTTSRRDQYWREERMQRGDTIGSVLARARVVDPDAMEFLRTDPSARALYQLRPGARCRVATDDDGRLLAIAVSRQQRRDTVGRAFRRRDSRAQRSAAGRDAPDDARRRNRSRRCSRRPTRPDCPTPITLALADVFGGDIDFYHDLRRGDRFIVLYETRYVDGEPAATGSIVAAEFVNRGVACTHSSGARRMATKAITTRRGAARARRSCARRWNSRASRRASRRRASIRSCTRCVRTRAPISRHRWARRSARPPTAWSTVAGQQNGYGNVVILKHDGAYSTVYAHLSRFARACGRGTRASGRHDRLRRADRLGDRAASALRVARRRRASRSADGRVADRNAGIRRGTRCIRRADRAARIRARRRARAARRPRCRRGLAARLRLDRPPPVEHPPVR